MNPVDQNMFPPKGPNKIFKFCLIFEPNTHSTCTPVLPLAQDEMCVRHDGLG